jgi:hypothetical protein
VATAFQAVVQSVKKTDHAKIQIPGKTKRGDETDAISSPYGALQILLTKDCAGKYYRTQFPVRSPFPCLVLFRAVPLKVLLALTLAHPCLFI